MTKVSEINQICKKVITDFCTQLNNWENIFIILERIEENSFVSAKNIKLAGNITPEMHLKAHAEIFKHYILPKVRKCGSNPGKPISWGQTFHDVSDSEIKEIIHKKHNCVEIITNWGFMLPNGQTQFVLKKQNNEWLIDNIKHRFKENERWEVSHF